MSHAKFKNEFSFIDRTHQEMVDYLNKKYPITLKYNDELISRIQERYPFLNKMDVAFIVRAALISIRNNVIMGKVLQIHPFFLSLYLFFWIEHHQKRNKKFPKVKLNMNTPQHIKDKDINS